MRQPLAFAVVVGALLLYRVGRALPRAARASSRARTAKLARGAVRGAEEEQFWSGELVVARIFDETPDVKTFRFVVADGGPLPFEHIAGQYLNLALTIDGKRVNRSYTIASSPTRARLLRDLGQARADGYALAAPPRRPGAKGSASRCRRPRASSSSPAHEAERVVLIAGGVGITPMMSIVRSLTDRCWRARSTSLFSVRAAARHRLPRRARAISQARFPNLHVASSSPAIRTRVGRRARPHHARADRRLRARASKRGPVLLCGPDADDDRDAQAARRHGRARRRDPRRRRSSSPAADAERGRRTARRARSRLEPDGRRRERAVQRGPARPPSCRRPHGPRGRRGGRRRRSRSSAARASAASARRSSSRASVTMEVQDALTRRDRAKGLILACQARCAKDVVIDASERLPGRLRLEIRAAERRLSGGRTDHVVGAAVRASSVLSGVLTFRTSSPKPATTIGSAMPCSLKYLPIARARSSDSLRFFARRPDRVGVAGDVEPQLHELAGLRDHVLDLRDARRRASPARWPRSPRCRSRS